MSEPFLGRNAPGLVVAKELIHQPLNEDRVLALFAIEFSGLLLKRRSPAAFADMAEHSDGCNLLAANWRAISSHQWLGHQATALPVCPRLTLLSCILRLGSGAVNRRRDGAIPSAFASRVAVSKEGFVRRPHSMAEIVVWSIPDRRASSSCVRPARDRASRSVRRFIGTTIVVCRCAVKPITPKS